MLEFHSRSMSASMQGKRRFVLRLSKRHDENYECWVQGLINSVRRPCVRIIFRAQPQNVVATYQCRDKPRLNKLVEIINVRAPVVRATAGCIFGGRPTPTDARALSTQEIQENQKIQPRPRYSYGGFETAHVDTSERARCTYVFRIVVSSHMAELRKPGHP